eukprot:TRINITY_DN10749_c0_g1_i1.p1 TRINITY_DN10749_c0_g1~~TRINITY_DN10749_c0_g1_i1.p1  ORF type:complete len:271 (-),score=37.85 TRINITY_DN10749_c0_g1_i1:114-809(-)
MVELREAVGMKRVIRTLKWHIFLHHYSDMGRFFGGLINYSTSWMEHAHVQSKSTYRRVAKGNSDESMLKLLSLSCEDIITQLKLEDEIVSGEPVLKKSRVQNNGAKHSWDQVLAFIKHPLLKQRTAELLSLEKISLQSPVFVHESLIANVNCVSRKNAGFSFKILPGQFVDVSSSTEFKCVKILGLFQNCQTSHQFTLCRVMKDETTFPQQLQAPKYKLTQNLHLFLFLKF